MTVLEAFDCLKNSIYTEVEKLETEVWMSTEPVSYENRLSWEHKTLSEGDRWGSLFDSAWFHFTGIVPEYSKGNIPVLLIDVNGELLLADEMGNPLRGLTNKSSTFDYKLGEPVKRVFRLPETVKPGDSLDYWADAGCNDLFGKIKKNGRFKQADIALCNEDIRRIYYDFEFLINLMDHSPKDDQLYKKIKTILEEASNSLSDFSEAALITTSGILKNILNYQQHSTELSVSAIGHSHLDLAWLWPIRETRRKIARTLSTVLELMNRYPDYIYGCSQPQLLYWVKKDYPDLYRRFKQRVSEGRIEVQGAMWVESDTNLPSGESLVRQIIIGKRFWKEEFNIEIDNLWLPDVFGYSGALPQILKQTGIKYFSTMKLSWNTVNKFPFHSFHWRGIDGSIVLAHMLPEETYNGPARPESVLKIMKNYNEKHISNHALMVFGIGDGGGGPGAEHLERLDRMKNMAGLARVKQEKISEFFPVWASESEKFPTWDGELYLEKHQGTFTTEALSKWYNRKIELHLRKMEIISTIGMIDFDSNYPVKKLEEIWKEVLLYQFHDILPGSSIKRVYDESWERYRTMLAETRHIIRESELNLISKEGFTHEEEINRNDEDFSIIVFNYLSWEISKWVFLNNRWARITIPPMGYTVKKIDKKEEIECELNWDSSFMENKVLRIEFADDGSILSVFDKENNYEVILYGYRGNTFKVYKDTGDAWDFPADYRSGDIEYFIMSESNIKRNGPELINHQCYRYSKSIIIQDIVLTDGERRIDFRTRMTWSDPGNMLRTSFPVDIPGGSALCEIQFGAIERPVHSNTSWDAAKDEISAHTWVDISNNNYGAAILNDSKYGHRVKDRILDLCLIRSVPYPGPVKGFTDLGEHNFTYSLFPHPGNYSNGGVVQAAHELNSPPCGYQIKPAAKNSSRSFFSTGDPSIVISSIKKAEDSDAIIIRLYESAGKTVTTWLEAEMLHTKRAELVNLLEEFHKPLEVCDGRIKLILKPYEISTIKLIPDSHKSMEYR